MKVDFDNRIGRDVALQGACSLLERALENLLKNAIEAETPFSPVQVILMENESGVAVLEIHNGGKSIPEAILKRYILTLCHPWEEGGRRA